MGEGDLTMEENKRKKANLQIIFSATLLVVVFIIELYTMMNMPQQFIVIGIFAILFLIFLYSLMQGILTKIQAKEERREEQYDSIFKSEKASYLMLKKHFEELEEALVRIESNVKVPTEEIVGTQKGIAKVIIGRNLENAESIIRSNDRLLAKLDENEKLLDEYKTITDSTVQQLMEKQQEMMMALKDMEIRLNNAIMQISAKTPSVVQVPVATPIIQESHEEKIPTPVNPDAPIEEPEAVDNADPVESIVQEPINEPEEVQVPDSEPEVEVTPEPEATPVPEPEQEPVVEEEKPPMPDLSDPNKQMSPDDIAALFANMAGEEAAKEAEPEVTSEPVVEEEKPPMPDLSDPNKQMSPDDIAALFANMAGEETAAEPEAAPEPEPVVEEEKPPMPDLSDPNKQLSADEIAALFANMG